MTTYLYSHESCLGHDTGGMHPEHPARLKAVLSALEDDAFAALERKEAPRAEIGQIARAHPEGYVHDILASVPQSGRAHLDSDTVLSAGSGEAALRAAGALCAAVDAVLAGQAKNAFCAVRPPGHHAEKAQAMGFCLFNNVAIGALQAREVGGCRRVAVVDFDVHHGNGTQSIFWDDPDLLLISSHQVPLYPGSGAADERGIADNILNIPLPPLTGSQTFREVYREQALPRLSAFQPEFILISAGFDAHADDPLASLQLHEEDFAWVTSEILAVAGSVCQGRVVSTLEGGYDLDALGRCAAAHVGALMAG